MKDLTLSFLNRLEGKFNGVNNLYLLFVSIGPVQDFISEARKAWDLWAGSYILSQITFRAMEPILKYYNCEDVIIYPQIAESPLYKLFKNNSVTANDLQFPSLPNHFLAVVDNLKILTDKICVSAKKYWDTLAESTHNLIPNMNKLWKSQIEDHFQVYWVAVPITLEELKSKGDYTKKHDEIQTLMESRKLTRTFIQWQGSQDFKCYQCGHREIIGSKDFWKDLTKKKEFNFKLKENEKLCAVCIIKRVAKASDILENLSPPQFDSTSDISSKPFREFLSTKESEEKVKGFVNSMNELCPIMGISEFKSISDVPGDWFYEEGLRLKALKKEFPSADEGKLKQGSENAIRSLKELAKEYKTSPSKYYVILMLDGDKIGKKISTLDINEQAELSRRIGELGNRIMPKIIHDSKGYPIYSGGDDLLAFLPLEKSVSSAFELRKAFENCLGNGFTSCASVVIVHHQDSLRRALEEARNGMIRAKNNFKRDSIVITLMLSSGTLITGGSKWNLPNDTPFTEFLTTLHKMMVLEKGPLGNQFIYDILKRLPAFYDKWNRVSKGMLESELKRLLDRHIPPKSTIRGNKTNLECVIQSIVSLADIRSLAINSEDNLSAILRISAFHARENLKEL